MDADGDGSRDNYNDILLAAVPETGEIRRFMTAVPGSEMTGLTGTPDRTFLFANIQHPGGSWPDGGSNPPRSATMIISKDDGGVVGGDLERNGGYGHGNGHGHGYGHGGGYGNPWLKALFGWLGR
jgi:hypothetical protein